MVKSSESAFVDFFAIHSTLQFTVGLAIAAGTADPGHLLQLPPVYAVDAALLFDVTGTVVPKWLSNNATLLGSLTIPMMLLTLAESLARPQIGNLRRSLTLSVVWPLSSESAGLSAGWLLGLGQPAVGVLAIQSAMPMAVFNYLFAQLYTREPAEGASMTFCRR